MHEKVLGQHQNDGVGAPVENPVALTREEKCVENHKGPVEVQGGKAAQHQGQHQGGDARPKGGAPVQQPVGAGLAQFAQNQQNGNVQNSEDGDDEDKERKLSKAEMKELQRKRINEARRRMAEKYGEEYNEKE